MNRRNFITQSGLGLLALSAVGLGVKAEASPPLTLFLDIFNKIPVDDSHKDKSYYEMPVDILFNDDHNISYTSNSGEPLRNIHGDYLGIPRYTSDLAGFDRDARNVILASAVDHNIIVYDAVAPQHMESPRLISLMKTTFRRNGKYQGGLAHYNIDTWVHHKALQLDVFDGFANHIALDNQSYTSMLNYYKQDLGGSLPADKHNIILGLSASTGSFVSPTWNESERGLACLDNTCVLIGAY